MAARRLPALHDETTPVTVIPSGATESARAPKADRGSDLPPLTPRQRDVLRHLGRGATNREIGATLGVAEKTVVHHSVSIYAKLRVRRRSEAAAWAERIGYLDPVPE